MSSFMQQHYLQARADGAGMTTAAVASGIPIAEARLIENAIARGDLALPSPAPEPEPSTQEGDNEMARKAQAANDEVQEIPQPDFERGLRIIKQDLNPLTEESAKVRGDQSAAWKEIEKGCHLNKKGAKFFHGLLRMDPEIRDDVLRTLYGLMKVSGIGISRDLVDQMGDGGEAPDMPVSDERAMSTDDLAAIAAE